MALDPVTELERVVDAFDEGQIEYALCGGLALAVHGHPRATQDIDVLVRSEALSEAIAVAKRVGFDQRVSKLDAETGGLLALDLIVVNGELEPVWATRETLRAGDRRLVVVSRAGLATMKRIAGRRQDLADLAKLEGTEDEDS